MEGCVILLNIKRIDQTQNSSCLYPRGGSKKSPGEVCRGQGAINARRD